MKFTYQSGQKPLEGYTIKRGIGKGGFGEVYFGISDGGKEVAQKYIRQHSDVELRGVGQCLNLKHPNLVHLYDLRKDSYGDSWLLMEYVAGESLSDILRRHPQGVATELACTWFEGLAAAIGYLHEHGIVHRDLKPGNIFIENGTVKVGDYGLCKLMGSQRAGQTQSVGTVHYMAPEISTGNYNKQIDVYAAGVILFELLTGQVPFDGESAGEILMKHMTKPPDLSKVPGPFAPILEKALSKNPANRYQTIGAMCRKVAAIAGKQAEPRQVPQPKWEQSSRQSAVDRPMTPSLARADTEHVPSPTESKLRQLSGTLVYSALLAGLLSMVAAAIFTRGEGGTLVHIFYLTIACTWAVLIPGKWWRHSLNDSASRRLLLMTFGVGVGIFALWLDGYSFGFPPASAEPTILLPHKPPIDAPQVRHPFFDALYSGNETLPVLASYLTYFGLMFLALRWWKITERKRPRSFSLRAVIATGFWAYLLLFLLPATQARMMCFMALVLTSVVIQLVSPWQPREQPRRKRLRLQWA